MDGSPAVGPIEHLPVAADCIGAWLANVAIREGDDSVTVRQFCDLQAWTAAIRADTLVADHTRVSARLKMDVR
jgi:hypothetical protein